MKSLILLDTLSINQENKDILLQVGFSILKRISNREFNLECRDPYFISPTIRVNIPEYIIQTRGITNNLLKLNSIAFRLMAENLEQYFSIRNSIVMSWDMNAYNIINQYCRLNKLSPLLTYNYVPIRPQLEFLFNRTILNLQEAIELIGKSYICDQEHDCCSNRSYNLGFLIEWLLLNK